MSGVRVSPGMLAHLDDVLRLAGAEGLSMAELRSQLGKSRTAVYATTAAARRAGTCEVEQQHPVAFYFHASVPESVRRATFERRAVHERQRRRAATVAGFAQHVAQRSKPTAAAHAAAPTRPALTRAHRPVRAVDPNGLKADATVTYPPGLQVQHCPGYRSLPERLLTDCQPEPLPEEPASPWVHAVLQARTQQPEER